MCDPSEGSHEWLGAIAANDMALVRNLYATNPELVDAYDNCGAGSLHYVQSAEMVQLLTQLGCNPQATSVSASTPLHYAARYGKASDVFTALVEAGCCVSRTDGQGRTVFHDLALSKRDFDRGACATAMFPAAQKAALDVLYTDKTAAQLAESTGHARLAHVLGTFAE